MKKIGMLITFVVLGLAGHSQATPKQADKQLQDPRRRADAGKADVIITRKKNIYDSTTFQNDTPKTAKGKTVKASVKTKPPGKAGATKKKD